MFPHSSLDVYLLRYIHDPNAVRVGDLRASSSNQVQISKAPNSCFVKDVREGLFGSWKLVTVLFNKLVLRLEPTCFYRHIYIMHTFRSCISIEVHPRKLLQGDRKKLYKDELEPTG